MEIIINDNDKIDENNSIIIKVVLIGDSGTGKTSFISRFFSLNYSQFIKENLSITNTNGASFKTVKVKYKNKLFILDFWDTAGLYKYNALLKFFYKDAKIILIFYDSFYISSFNRLKELLNNIKESNDNNPLIGMIRNKYEINSNKYNNLDFISDEEALEYADRNKLFFCHLSNYEKYETGFNQLIEILLNEYLKNK